MNEDQAERIAEREMDRLDRAFLAGTLTERQYTRSIRSLDTWVRAQVRKGWKP